MAQDKNDKNAPATNGAMGGMMEELMAVVARRAAAAPDESWTAQLLSAGGEKIVKKFGEEAIELVMAAGGAAVPPNPKDRQQVIMESADVLFHLAVLWHYHGITAADVATELRRRQNQSGLAEKLSRKK